MIYKLLANFLIIKEVLSPAGHNQEVPHARILKRVMALEERLLKLHETYHLVEYKND